MFDIPEDFRNRKPNEALDRVIEELNKAFEIQFAKKATKENEIDKALNSKYVDVRIVAARNKNATEANKEKAANDLEITARLLQI